MGRNRSNRTAKTWRKIDTTDEDALLRAKLEEGMVKDDKPAYELDTEGDTSKSTRGKGKGKGKGKSNKTSTTTAPANKNKRKISPTASSSSTSSSSSSSSAPAAAHQAPQHARKKRKGNTKTVSTYTRFTADTSATLSASYSVSSGMDIWSNELDDGQRAHIAKVASSKGFLARGELDKLGKNRRRSKKAIVSNSKHARSGNKIVTGLSVNPTAEDVQAELRAAHEMDVEEVREAEDIRLKLRHAHPDQQLLGPGHIPQDVEGGEESARAPVKKVVKKKTITERNRLQAIKDRAEARQKEQAQSKLHKQIDNLDNIVKRIDSEEVALARRRARAQKLAPEEVRLGKNDFKEDYPEFLFKEELRASESSIRNVNASQRVVRDTFRRFEYRNIIEPRHVQKKSKTLHKMSHKEVYRNSYKEQNWDTKYLNHEEKQQQAEQKEQDKAEKKRRKKEKKLAMF
jgi:hypothetical protein